MEEMYSKSSGIKSMRSAALKRKSIGSDIASAAAQRSAAWSLKEQEMTECICPQPGGIIDAIRVLS
jgi:hypothetical protein